MSRQPFLQKLTLRNFRSIKNEVIVFPNPLFLVGRNDTGKTNLLEALSFLSDCMSLPLQTAVDSRGGFSDLSYLHEMGEPYEAPIHVRADFFLKPSKQTGHYAFSLGFVGGSANDFDVLHEQCSLTDGGGDTLWFDREADQFRTNVIGFSLQLDSQALALPLAAGMKAFAPVRRALETMRVYAIEPNRIRAEKTSSGSRYLQRDGGNVVSILQKMSGRDPDVLERIRELLGAIVPTLTDLYLVSEQGKRPELMFTQKAAQNEDFLFSASRMADGTLRVLGLLTAAMQEPPPMVIAFDEPELYLHPGAVGAVSDIIQMAAGRSQVIVTTHSPELIDSKWITPENLRVVQKQEGATQVAGLDVAPQKAIRQHLMGAGELMRANALDTALPSPYDPEPALFDPVSA
jgi:predicted ATPase